MLWLSIVVSLAVAFQPQDQGLLQLQGRLQTLAPPLPSTCSQLKDFDGSYSLAPGGEGVSYNAAYQTDTPAHLFDQNTQTIWNAGHMTGWNVNNWFLFGTSIPVNPRRLNFVGVGDVTHDANSWVLSVSTSFSGPWTQIATGVAAPGVAYQWQNFNINYNAKASFFKLEFPTRYSQYQLYLAEVSLSVCVCEPSLFNGVTAVLPGSDGVAYNGGWAQGNQLGDKAFDGDLNTQWNAGSGSNAQSGWDVNDWIVFTTSSPVVVSGVAFATAGDSTHDAATWKLSGGSSNKGPWQLLLSGNAQGGTSQWQLFNGANNLGQAYSTFLLEFPTRQTRYQVYLREAALIVCECQRNGFAGLSVRPGGDGVAFNGQWSNGNQLAAKAFDGDLTTQWNAGSGDNAQTGWNVNNWVIFTSGAPFIPRGVQFATAGDVTHDIQTWKLSYGDSFDGPWTVGASGNAQGGNSGFQAFTVNSDRPSAFYKFEAPTRQSQYQAYVKEIQLSGCASKVIPYGGSYQVVPGSDGVAFSGAWTLGGQVASNIFDGRTDTVWNTGSGSNAQTGWNVNNWVIFTTSTPVQLAGVSFASLGDTTHDPNAFKISYGDSASGPWTLALAGSAAATGNLQNFSGAQTDNRGHSFFKLEFPTRFSQYQAVIREVKLNVYSY